MMTSLLAKSKCEYIRRRISSTAMHSVSHTNKAKHKKALVAKKIQQRLHVPHSSSALSPAHNKRHTGVNKSSVSHMVRVLGAS
jgi:hypothetical protein